MRRMLALSLALALLAAAIPAHARSAAGRIALEDDARTHNALQAADRISGTTLQPGDSFSFNDTVGPRTPENGFVSALNGRGAEVVGGGCAQAASALYLALCALPPGSVAFDELSFYGDRYAGSYVSDGCQAVLVDYSAGLDFRFTNLCGGALDVAMEARDGQLVCTVEVGGAGAMPPAPDAGDAAAPALPTDIVIIDCGEDPAVLNNVSLAADSVYDATLASGDVFSFNRAVGPRSAAYGFVSAADGRGEEVMGGGVAQVASAIWLLIRDRADVVIVEKSTYGSAYNQTYVSSSADAIAVDYASDTDFSFRYTGSGSLTLYVVLDADAHLLYAVAG